MINGINWKSLYKYVHSSLLVNNNVEIFNVSYRLLSCVLSAYLLLIFFKCEIIPLIHFINSSVDTFTITI